MPPRLSVVVPFYNVELYLRECLASLAEQSFTDLDVVMVDDGSSDTSASIAAEFEAADPRFRLIRQVNKGLGAARNTGAGNISPDSEYLAFVDGDDLLPADAYASLVDSLDSTGSDLASGNVQMFRSTGAHPSPMHKKAFATTRLKTHISRDRVLISDRTAWNKVFRRSFWDTHAFAFPEGVLYEDAPVTVPAHFMASSADVLNRPVYYWRQREAGAPSITQDRTNPVGLRDRMAAIDGVSRFLAERPEFAQQRDWYDETALTTEIPLYFDVLPEAGEEFREIFLDSVADYTSRVSPQVIAQLPVPMRLMLHLTGERRLTGLLALKEFQRENHDSLPTRRRRLNHYADYPFLRRSGIPDSVLLLGPELPLRTRVDEVGWKGGTLRVAGHAYIRNLPPSRRRRDLKVAMLRGKGRRPLVVPARTVFRPEATAATGQTLHDYDWSGFEFTLDTDRLKTGGRWVDGVWKLTIGVLGSGGTLRRSRIKVGGSSLHLPALHVDEGIRIVPVVSDDHLDLRVETMAAWLTGHRQLDGAVELSGELRSEAPAEGATGTLRLLAGPSGRAGKADTGTVGFSAGAEGRTRFTALLDQDTWAADRDAEPRSVQLVLPGGRALDLAVDSRLPAVSVQYPWADAALCLSTGADGQLTVCRRATQAVADRVEWTGPDLLTIEGTYPVPGTPPMELVLRNTKQAEEYAFPVEADGQRFRAEFPPAPRPVSHGSLPLRQGQWQVLLRPVGAAGTEGFPLVRVAPQLHGAFPAEATVRGKRCTVSRRLHDQLLIETHSDQLPSEQGAYRQREWRTRRYPAARREPLREAVLYDAFSGRQFSDSPRAIHRELLRRDSTLEHLVVVRDHQVELPEGVTPVRLAGPEWYDALARCRYIVTNTHQPSWLERRPGQVIVQTWHGTPLKRIGHDLGGTQPADRQYLARLAAETPQWSFLLSPNRASTPILQQALDYRGEILESGCPRNDLLFAPPAERQQRAAEVRERLGLPEGKKVVLYAPTWRDDRSYGAGRCAFDFHIDAAKAAAELGDDHVLLVRKHPHVVDTLADHGDGFVMDVSSYPELSELFLVTDVLVSDYSSLIVDFAHTGRPMVFLTYDLAHYRDTLRGFSFDFEKYAPGPLVATSADLVAAIRDLDRVSAEYAEAYEEFRGKFCDLDDGGAAGRVVDRMLAP